MRIGLRAGFVTVLAVLAIPGGFLSVLSARQTHDALLAEAREQALRVVRVAAANQAHVSAGAEMLLAAMADSPDIFEALSDPAACDRITRNFPRSSLTLQYTGLTIARPDGKVTCSVPGVLKGLNLAERDWFQAVLREKRLIRGTLAMGRISGDSVLPFGQPLLDGDGKLAGVVALGLRNAWFEVLMNASRLPAGSRLAVFRSDGMLLLTYPAAPTALGWKFEHPWIERALAGTADEGVEHGMDSEGQTRMIAYKKLPENGSLLTISMDVEAEMAAADWAQRRTLITWLGLFVLLTGLAVLLINRALLDPLGRLLAAARQIGSGNIAARAGTARGFAEVEELARDFDAMGEALQRQQEEARAATDKFRMLFESANDAILFHEYRGGYLEANSIACSLLGYAREELIGRMPTEIHTPDFQDRLDDRRQILQERGSIVYEASMIARDGREIPVEANAKLITYDGRPAVLTVVRDISERKRAEERIRYLAHHDPMTDLPNRTLLNDRLDFALAQATRSGQWVALLFLDLDGFKPINDCFGHQTGDLVLRETARRLKEAVRSTDTVARMGGDEFAVMLTNAGSRESVAAVAEKLVQIVSQPIDIGGGNVQIGASIGIAISPEDAPDAETLLRLSDEAMYRAKEAGKNCWRMHEPQAA